MTWLPIDEVPEEWEYGADIIVAKHDEDWWYKQALYSPIKIKCLSKKGYTHAALITPPEVTK